MAALHFIIQSDLYLCTPIYLQYLYNCNPFESTDPGFNALYICNSCIIAPLLSPRRPCKDRGHTVLYSLTSIFARLYICNTSIIATLLIPPTLVSLTLYLQFLHYCTSFESTETVQR